MRNGGKLPAAASPGKAVKALRSSPVSVSPYPAASDVNLRSVMRIADRGAEQTGLQQPHFDIGPEPGMLVLFPIDPNTAMPCGGESGRIIASRNAQVHGAQGHPMFGHAAA